MYVPKHWILPEEGKLRCGTQAGWARSRQWYVYDYTGHVLTSGDLYTAVQRANRDKRPTRAQIKQKILERINNGRRT